jgi:hypothetical protein
MERLVEFTLFNLCLLAIFSLAPYMTPVSSMLYTLSGRSCSTLLITSNHSWRFPKV